jgi:hypothetical protein
MCRNLLLLLIAFASAAVHAQEGVPSFRAADTTAYVRLIFIANCFTSAENSAFRYAAANLTADYERDAAFSRQVVKRIYFDNARQIVDSINHQRLVIKSVDFLSHSRDDRIGAEMTRGAVQYRTSLFESRERLEEARVLTDAEGGDLRNSSRMASIEEIDFSHFSYDAVIEIHGCHGGTVIDSLPANVSRRLSRALYMSGKQLAVVIGHATRANPNEARGAGTRSGVAAAPGPGFKESVLSQDYRHGLRLAYFNGRSILATRAPGAIPQATIISAIIQAQNAQVRGISRPGR